MEKRYLNFFGVIGLLIILLGVFVSANPSAPTDLYIDSGESGVYLGGYDDGFFSVNWTPGVGGDENASYYFIYISTDGGTSWNTKEENDSTTGYSLNDLADANYTFRVEAINEFTLNATNSSSDTGIVVDMSGPKITEITSFTNATFKRSEDNLTFDFFVIDTAPTGTYSPGFIFSACIVNINGGTNTSKSVESSGVFNDRPSEGWYWLGECNYTLVLAGLSDGNQTINIYVNDTLNNILWNQSAVVQIDSTAPTPIASCSHSSAISGEIVECTCSASSESGSGVNESLTSDGSNITTYSIGTFDYVCSVTDNLGNRENKTISYTVTSASGSASSSGGGGGGSTTTTTTNTSSSGTITVVIAETDSKNDSIIVKFDEKVGVKEIEIRVNNDVQGVKIIVSNYEGKPENVSVEKSGEVYQYIQIETENLKDSLESATITIRVEKSWVSENNINKDDLALFKFNNETNEWDELVTIYKEEDDTYYYFDSVLTSFSFFAISISEKTNKNLILFFTIVLSVILIAFVTYLIMKKKNIYSIN